MTLQYEKLIPIDNVMNVRLTTPLTPHEFTNEIGTKTIGLTANDVALLNHAAGVARRVSQLNRNKEGPQRTIKLVTDQLDVISEHYPFARIPKTVTQWGMTWSRNINTAYINTAYIWISPTHLQNNARHNVLRTYIHELAHAVTSSRTCHNWTFRRMYGLLLTTLGPIFGVDYDVRKELGATISQYQRMGTTYRPVTGSPNSNWDDTVWQYERHEEELKKHLTAIDRFRKRHL
jgi:hypothetical protein